MLYVHAVEVLMLMFAVYAVYHRFSTEHSRCKWWMQWHHSYVAIHSFTLYDIEHSAAGGVRASICRLMKVMSEARGIYNSACKGTTVSACLCTIVAQVIKFNMIILIRKHHPSELCKQKPPRLSFGSCLLGTKVTSGCAISSSHPLPAHAHSLEGQQVGKGGANRSILDYTCHQHRFMVYHE